MRWLGMLFFLLVLIVVGGCLWLCGVCRLG